MLVIPAFVLAQSDDRELSPPARRAWLCCRGLGRRPQSRAVPVSVGGSQSSLGYHGERRRAAGKPCRLQSRRRSRRAFVRTITRGWSARSSRSAARSGYRRQARCCRYTGRCRAGTSIRNSHWRGCASPPPVPTTAIYAPPRVSPGRASHRRTGAQRRNDHPGEHRHSTASTRRMLTNPQTIRAVAERLARPPGASAPRNCRLRSPG